MTIHPSHPNADAQGGRVRRVGFGERLSRWDVKLSPYLYVSPFFVLFLVTGVFPIGFTAVISFLDWDLVRGPGSSSDWISTGT